jgi:nucleoid-associated protein YgaU
MSVMSAVAADCQDEAGRPVVVPMPQPASAVMGERVSETARAKAGRTSAARPATIGQMAVRPAAIAEQPAAMGRSAATGQRSPTDRGAALAAGPAWPAPAMVSRAVQGPSSRGPGRGPAPVRLTRRGRAVLTALIAAVAIVVVTLLCTGAAGGAQASSQHGPARAGYQGMTQIVVQRGQTLWSIALSAEPSANTQTVVQQIADANALGGTSLKAGQLLWVPKG